MTAIQWPNWISPNSMDWWLESPTRSAGPSILGNERIIASPSARWRGTMTFRIWGTRNEPGRMLFWRSFSAMMGGRAGSVQIGPFDLLTPGILSSGDAPAPVLISFSDHSLFFDGTSFSEDPSGTGGVALLAGVARGDQVMTVIVAGGGPPLAGQYFGLGGSELHIATFVTNHLDGTYSVAFAPPMRAPFPAGSVVDFDAPRCTMRLLADDTARQKITVGGVADVTLDLVEIF